ncbi:MAG: L-lactate permease [Anaerolineae bacterium]|nr:L-lactate permease [Anaerolineae bacterium]
MDYNELDWLLALIPLLAVLGLMVGFSWSASRAGLVGWLLAIGLAALRFGAGTDALAYAQLKALILAVDVSLIIWAALLLYAIADRAGALTVIAEGLSGLTSDGLIQVLLLGWVFASFLQGVGGFGVPVAIVAPLLIGLNVPQVRAVIVPSLGHGWAVTFGSLAASFVMLIRAVDMPGEDLALAPAIMLGVLCLASGLMIAHVMEGWRGVWRALPFVLVTGTAMSVAQGLLAVYGLWTLGAIGGGFAGLVAAAIWIRWRAPAHEERPAPAVHPGRPLPSIRLALSAYAILVILAFGLRGIVPVKDFLARWAVGVDIPATTTDRGWTVPEAQDEGFGIPGHPGLVILYSSLIAYALFRRRGLYAPGAGRDILAQSGRRAWRSAIGVFMMVAIAATMTRAGMMDILARGMSENIPADLYAFVAPVIGALGAFVTGSNVNSNAVFGLLQRSTAELLGLSVVTILGAQTAAAAVASVLSPAKVAVGCSTVGANEGVVLRRLLGYGAVQVVLVGIMAWIGLHIR